MQTKILIVKLGYSETLDAEIGKVPSLGDVLRTTPILWALKEKYPNSHITWLVSEHAEPLLHNNPFLSRTLVWDSFVPFQLMKEKFDVLINLEKIPGVCALADMVDAWVKYGFRFETTSGTYHGYEQGLDFISYIENKGVDSRRRHWQQVLIEMLGVPWKNQPYVVGYKPKTTECHDVGFNFEVGSKWPFKAMPMEMWQELEKMLTGKGISVSWQEGRSNLFEYMDWINTCRMLVSSDSLGLHLAFAFRKKTIGLFGPTDPNEVYFYDQSEIVRSPECCAFMPCIAARCASGRHCMGSIDLDELTTTIVEALSRKMKPTPKVYKLKAVNRC